MKFYYKIRFFFKYQLYPFLAGKALYRYRLVSTDPSGKLIHCPKTFGTKCSDFFFDTLTKLGLRGILK